MKTLTSLAVLIAVAALGACAPIPPRFSESPPEAKPATSVNQPSQAESTAAEYEGPSSSTGSSTRD